MSTLPLGRWVGRTAIAAGVLVALSALLGLPYALREDFSTYAREPLYVLGNAVFLASMPFVLLALVGLYGLQAHRAGLLGRVGFVAAFVTGVLVAGAAWTFTFVEPTLAYEAPQLLDNEQPQGPVIAGFILTFIGSGVGLLLFAVATLRAGVLPKAPAVLVILFALTSVVPFPLPGTPLLLGVGLAWWGVAADRVSGLAGARGDGRGDVPAARPQSAVT